MMLQRMSATHHYHNLCSTSIEEVEHPIESTTYKPLVQLTNRWSNLSTVSYNDGDMDQTCGAFASPLIHMDYPFNRPVY
jgi:hypothetical protein